MRKILLVLATILALLGIVFTILPLGTLAYLPAGLALIFSLVAYRLSQKADQKFPKIVLIVSVVTLLAIVGKQLLIKPEVKVDQKFEQVKQQSNDDAKKELEKDGL